MNRTLCASAVMLACWLPAVAPADPLPGRDILKFAQEPMLETALVDPTGQTHIFRGHDELSTAYGRFNPATNELEYQGRFMADDFADRFKSPVVHVRWWGSYMNQTSPTAFPVPRFLISFEKDIPEDPANGIFFSRPGDPLLNQIVHRGPLFPGSGTFTEKFVAPSDADGATFEYNAELHLGKEFRQRPNEVFWLKIVALYDVPDNIPPDLLPQWGWHNRDYTVHNPLASVPPDVIPGERDQAPAGSPFPIWHFQDDAVSGRVNVKIDPSMPIMPLVRQDEFRPENYLPPFDGPPFIQEFSKDLAFHLYTVPEPASLMLGLVALVSGMILVGKNRR